MEGESWAYRFSNSKKTPATVGIPISNHVLRCPKCNAHPWQVEDTIILQARQKAKSSPKSLWNGINELTFTYVRYP